MGKDWLYWGSGGGSAKLSATKRGRSFSREVVGNGSPPPSGCISSVLQIFDFGHFQFASLHHPSLNPDCDNASLQDFHQQEVPRGLEAPRNSLELQETPINDAASVSSTVKQDTSLNIPVGIQTIRTSCDAKSPRESTSECGGSSPGAKTPGGVVARLMGLDLLPEAAAAAASPSSSSSRYSTPTTSIKSRLQQHYNSSAVNRNEDRARHLLRNSSNNDKNNNHPSGGTRSLPETPRVSSSSRKSDVDQSRLSLQINKENTGGEDQFDLAAYIAKRVARRRDAIIKQEEDESRSPRHYARQIVKQVKERVGRKVGLLDITNTIKNNNNSREQAKEEHVVLLKPKKSFKVFTRSAGDECSSQQSTPSRSPRLRFLETKNNKPPPLQSSLLPNESQTSPPAKFSNESSSVRPVINQLVPREKISLEAKSDNIQQQQRSHQAKSAQKCDGISNERFSLRLKRPPQATDAAIRNKKDEPFIRSPPKKKGYLITEKTSSSRKIPLSNELRLSNHNNVVPTIFHPPAKLIHNKGVEVSDAQSSRSKQLYSGSSQMLQNSSSSSSTTVQGSSSQDRCKGATTLTDSSGGGGKYYYHNYYGQYIQRILKRTGIDRSTPVTLAKWYSPSHPLDPATFHYIELFHLTNSTFFTSKNSKLSQRSYRKLIFHLADELLAEILRPYINLRPWVSPSSYYRQDYLNSRKMDGSELTEELCSRIQAFPSANCQVLEDIDELIERDLQRKSSWVAYEEEGEGIVSEIERDIVDRLVHETAVEVFGKTQVAQQQYTSRRRNKI